MYQKEQEIVQDLPRKIIFLFLIETPEMGTQLKMLAQFIVDY